MGFNTNSMNWVNIVYLLILLSVVVITHENWEFIKPYINSIIHSPRLLVVLLSLSLIPLFIDFLTIKGNDPLEYFFNTIKIVTIILTIVTLGRELFSSIYNLQDNCCSYDWYTKIGFSSSIILLSVHLQGTLQPILKRVFSKKGKVIKPDFSES